MYKRQILHSLRHSRNLPGQLRRLPGQRGNFAFGLRLGTLQIAQGGLCGLVFLPRFGLLLRQFVLFVLRVGGLARKKGAKKQPRRQNSGGEVCMPHHSTNQ